MRERPAAGPAPTEASLREAALRHLARFAATRAGLIRVLDRRIERWARATGETETTETTEIVVAARVAARKVAERLVELGLVNDAAFAATRARSLTRAGRSRQAVAAHLVARGVAPTDIKEALPEDAESELAAALLLARRRRLGPFRIAVADPDTRRKELAVLARAGFTQPVASRALRMEAHEAEQLVTRLRQS